MKSTKIVGIVALLAVGACVSTATKPTTAPLDDVLRAAVEQKRVPAVVAMVATGDGVVYQGAVGVGKDGIFSIASMTKPVTSVAVMQLVEAGKVKLDEPAATYLPELGAVQVLENGALRAAKGQITVRLLLTHTAGFAYEFLNRELFDYASKGKVPSVMAGGDGFMKAPLLFDPGARWEYGINTDWLGKLVEKVSGQTLEAYFKEHIFTPLGMADSFFEAPADKRARLVPHFQRADDGKLVEQPAAPAQPVTFFSGGGGLHSTAGDYIKFARAMMAGGQLGQARVLTAESVALMGQNQIGELELRPPTSVMPQLVNPGAILPGNLDKFGLGFALNTKPVAKGRGAGTLSWAGIFNTFFWIDRDKKVCAVLMTQVLPFLDDGSKALVDDFDRAVYAWRDAAAR
jgi:CubicO group peptidase (beta-lactamase class C family)